MANPLFSISQANYLQRQNLPTTINFDWLNQQQPVQSQNQGGFSNLQPYYPRTDIDFLNLNSDGFKYSRNEDGTLGRVAGVSETAVTPATQQATEQQAQSVQQQPVQPAETTTATTTNAPVQSANDVINKVQPPQNKPPKLFETPKTLQPEVNQSILNTIPEGYYNKVNTQPLLNTSDLELAMQLGNLKQKHYARDLIIGTLDDQLNSGNLTENQKKKALDAKNYYQNEQDQIHQYAEMLRNGSGSNVDWSNYGFGSDDNLAQTQVSLYNQQRRNLQRFLNLPTAAEIEQKSFNDYRNQGYNSWQARIMAQENAANARNENSRNYANAMNFYGINSDGSLNSMGVELANRWAKDDPQSAGIYLQSYALPNTQFNARVNLANSALSQEHADWRSILNAALQGYGIDVRNKQFQKTLEETMRQHNLNYDLGKERIGIAQRRLDLDTLKTQANEYEKEWRRKFDESKEFAKTHTGKINDLYNFYLGLGLSESEAKTRALQNYLTKIGDIKDPTKQETAMQVMYDDLFEQMNNGNFAATLELYNQYKTGLGAETDPTKKYEGLSRETAARFRRYDDAIDNFFDKTEGTTDKNFAHNLAVFNNAVGIEDYNDWILRRRNQNHNKDNSKQITEQNQADENVKKILGGNGSSGTGNF